MHSPPARAVLSINPEVESVSWAGGKAAVRWVRDLPTACLWSFGCILGAELLSLFLSHPVAADLVGVFCLSPSERRHRCSLLGSLGFVLVVMCLNFWVTKRAGFPDGIKAPMPDFWRGRATTWGRLSSKDQAHPQGHLVSRAGGPCTLNEPLPGTWHRAVRS